ncbi:carboxylesterase/lipase family protein [Herbiconiux sp. SYSU D00978]|uniref:carboxylesterase/lipase family protein n=1 Tax=Herbiconiux sp. SYSU D00978 TaxID=2812562 RepID=UPI001A97B897|nr:carboxylesterase/lipase family protein [Herbiconiux sp. SYSU D00978]
MTLTVRTTAGLVRGVRRGGLREWWGIRYARAERFRAPRPVEPWEGLRGASVPGPVCPQERNARLGGGARGPMDEDCLFLNVQAPEDADGLPVVVFIHGGAYRVGAGSLELYDGRRLAERGVVYVSLNYRLGALGYLDFTRYSTAEHPFESNLGLRDQVAALTWVQENISGFGGDPGNVTIVGESSGGNAVTTLLATAAARGLFARAIAQSPCPNAVYEPRLTAQWAEEFVELAGGVDRLLTLPATALAALSAQVERQTPDEYPGAIVLCPVIDGDYLPERPIDAMANGTAAAVPLLVGTNADEGTLFRGDLDILATTPERVDGVLSATPPHEAERIRRAYDGYPSSDALHSLGGDYAFWLATTVAAERHSAHAPVHFYRFDFAPRLVKATGFGATHGLELYALFGDTSAFFRTMTALGGRRAFDEIGERMRQWWVSFATDGSLPWPQYEPERRATWIIDAEDRLELDPYAERREAWRAYVPHL